MSNNSYETFMDSIVTNLEANGFPLQKVSLPLEKMYDIADKKGLNLNSTLQKLQEEKSINVEKTGDKIIFSKPHQKQENPFSDINLDGQNKEDLMKKAQDFMSSMTPEQMEEIKSAYEKMSPKEKEEIIKKGKDMGLI